MTRIRSAGTVFAVAVLVIPSPLAAQDTGSVAAWEPPPARSQPFDLTIRNIMRGPELLGKTPRRARFTDDGAWIHFNWLPGGEAWDQSPHLYRISPEGGEPERVPEPEADSVSSLLLAGNGDVSRDGEWRVTSWRGDLWLVDRGDMTVERLTDTRATESSPMFSDDGDRVFYREDDNLFSMGILDGAVVRQVTDIRSGRAPTETEAEGLRQFLEEQQTELFEHIRRRRAEEARRDSLREAREAGQPEPLWIPDGERVSGLTPSPDASLVLVSTSRSAGDARRTMVPSWVTESGYTEELTVRTKVGDTVGSARLGLLRSATGEVTWIEPEAGGHEGDVSTGVVGWNDAGTHALVQARSGDDEGWWLYAVDGSNGELTLLDHLRDAAWVGGPCSFGCAGWLPDSDRAYYVTEETGYAHVYTVRADGTGKQALTSGDWEVLDLDIPRGGGRFLVTTNEGSPFNQHAGWLAFDGGPIQYLTRGRGGWDATLSPDLERLALIHSRANKPPELFVAPASAPGDTVRITTSPTAEWLSFDWIEPEMVHFRAQDGTMVPARIYRPADVGARPNGAGVVFVHGAGYLHNVHDYWSTYEREFMFNHFLAASGYTVLDVDYRGSAGYGRDWRTAIFRHMGGKDLSDQVDGARYLVEREGVDADRMGIYGGSYGGFITLMALFTAGDSFKSGAALRSVTDWAHYNEGYTSNILNDPQEDDEAYRRSSPIYFAEGFGPDQHLVMLHGMVDTNVHFSDVVRLAQRLIELGKENWEMAVYPVENHAFVEPGSWTDEYRRIFELFERTLSEPGCTANGGLCAVPRGG